MGPVQTFILGTPTKDENLYHGEEHKMKIFILGKSTKMKNFHLGEEHKDENFHLGDVGLLIHEEDHKR